MLIHELVKGFDLRSIRTDQHRCEVMFDQGVDGPSSASAGVGVPGAL